MFLEIPSSLEEFSVALRRLTDQELHNLAHITVDKAMIWYDDPRQWPNYDSFLGFQISASALHYALDSDQLQALIDLAFQISFRIGQTKTQPRPAGTYEANRIQQQDRERRQAIPENAAKLAEEVTDRG